MNLIFNWKWNSDLCGLPYDGLSLFCLAFVLCYFFEFHDSDADERSNRPAHLDLSLILQVAVMQLRMLLEDPAQDSTPDSVGIGGGGGGGAVAWAALWYVIGDVTYGGRVTDDNDRRCLHSLLHKFFHPRALDPQYNYSPDKVRPASRWPD